MTVGDSYLTAYLTAPKRILDTASRITSVYVRRAHDEIARELAGIKSRHAVSPLSHQPPWRVIDGRVLISRARSRFIGRFSCASRSRESGLLRINMGRNRSVGPMMTSACTPSHLMLISTPWNASDVYANKVRGKRTRRMSLKVESCAELVVLPRWAR